MKKRIMSLCIALALVFVTAFSSVAASRGVIELSDFRRFQELVSETRGKNAKIVNYEHLANGEWMVRLKVRDDNDKGDQCEGDFRISYSATAPDKFSPYNNLPCWYWFGLFDNTNNICGYAIAVREYQAMVGQKYNFAQADNYQIPELQ